MKRSTPLSTSSHPGTTRRLGVFSGLAILLAMGCDSGPQAKDASATSRSQIAQVQIRIDLPSAGSPAVSVLAFRAQATDLPSASVLPTVDPLASPPPESGCELREISAPARQVRTQGGTVNLQELEDISLEISTTSLLRPMPRVYPPFADVVGGVIAEVGPTEIEDMPSAFVLATGGRGRFKLATPTAPSLRDAAETPLSAQTRLEASGDLVLGLTGPSKGFLEIRPFGAPTAIACTPNARGWVVVPHALLGKLTAGTAGAPVAFEAVSRDTLVVDVSGEPVRVSVEARSQVVLELAP
jgi:hypothetical protein